VETGKFSNATAGLDKLATVNKKPPKSVMRMLGPRGKPQPRNFFESSLTFNGKKAFA
jgi:hypothetical protein